MIRRLIPAIALFGWHSTDVDDQDGEAHGAMLRLVWFGLIVEIGLGRVLK